MGIITVILSGAILPFVNVICGQSEYNGVYINSTKQIYVCHTENKRELKFTKLHEIAHYIYFEKLSQQQRNQYLNICKNSQLRGREYFFRDYGYNNCEEDFADNFALYKMNMYLNLPLGRQRINLIKKWTQKLNVTSLLQ